MRRGWITGAALTVALGCGGGASYPMTGLGTAVGADGHVAVETTSAGNRQVQLEVSHLPPPQRLGEGYDAYHVWVAPLGRSPVLLGRLEYDAESRAGYLDAVTPHDGFRLLITPERSGLTDYPSGVAVFDRYIGS